VSWFLHYNRQTCLEVHDFLLWALRVLDAITELIGSFDGGFHNEVLFLLIGVFGHLDSVKFSLEGREFAFVNPFKHIKNILNLNQIIMLFKNSSSAQY
jgi:hypothetical protein